MLRFGIVTCAVRALLAVGCGKKEGGERTSSNSSASTGSVQRDTFEEAKSVIAASRPLDSTSQAGPDEPTSEPGKYVPAVAEDDSKTPKLTVEQVISNPTFYDRKFALRQVEVSGILVKKENDVVWLGSSDTKAETTLTCRFSDAAAIGKVSAGSKIVIRGQLDRDMAQSLNGCNIVSN